MLLSTKQLQESLNVSRDMAYKLMRSKSFPSMKLSGRYKVDEEELKRWLRQSAYKQIAI